MKNKELENLLKNFGSLDCISLIELCETDDGIKEIEVDASGFTPSKFLNERIEGYLKKLNIEVKYVNMKNRLVELGKPKPTKLEKKDKCSNVVHLDFKCPMSKKKKVEMYTNYKMGMFKLDADTYVICPDCKDFVKL
jgi:hypothetical protein